MKGREQQRTVTSEPTNLANLCQRQLRSFLLFLLFLLSARPLCTFPPVLFRALFPSWVRPSRLCSAVYNELRQGERLQHLHAAARRHAQLCQETPADGGQGFRSPPAAHQRHQLHQAGGGPGQRPGPASVQHALHRHRYR